MTDNPNELPWDEKVPAISINPDMATRDDIARMAAELMELRYESEGYQKYNISIGTDLLSREKRLETTYKRVMPLLKHEDPAVRITAETIMMDIKNEMFDGQEPEFRGKD